ncbi:MAG TPA: hypothetical protein VMD98_12225 [Bryocella sp.]|nr:hypothetical protein [Bryocella sp.]
MNYQNMSQLGKRSLQLLSGMLILYGVYFARVLRNLGQSQFAGEALWSLIWAVVAIIGIEILYHVAAPPAGVQPEPKDERDNLIESKAYRNGYFAYGTGAFLVISAVIAAGFAHISVTPFLMVNLVLLSMVLAEVVKFVTQLLYYTRG